MASIGNRIKVLRKAVGMSQERLAELLSVSRPTVSQIENGDRKVSAEELKKLADIFNTSMDSLLNPKKEPKVFVKESRTVYQTKPQIRINIPQKNLEKFREVFLYILNKV